MLARQVTTVYRSAPNGDTYGKEAVLYRIHKGTGVRRLAQDVRRSVLVEDVRVVIEGKGYAAYGVAEALLKRLLSTTGLGWWQADHTQEQMRRAGEALRANPSVDPVTETGLFAIEFYRSDRGLRLRLAGDRLLPPV